MVIKFNYYKCFTTLGTKSIKFIGDNIGLVSIVVVIGCGIILMDYMEKENTKYEHDGWILYRQGDFLYAINGKQKIKIEAETNDFCKLESVIKNITEHSSRLK